MKRIKAVFKSEAELCAAFIASIPDQWKAYPETAGFDILLVHSDGWQVGVEAKMALNVKVLNQVLPPIMDDQFLPRPDFMAVLVPKGSSTDGLGSICHRLGVVVIEQDDGDENRAVSRYYRFWPRLPEFKSDPYGEWFDWCPAQRCNVPDYIPDVAAGAPSPIALTAWKVKAIKISVLLDRRGFVCPNDFKMLRISMSLWRQERWLAMGDCRGRLVRGRHMPDFKAQHPINYDQIAADFDVWAPKGQPQFQGALL